MLWHDDCRKHHRKDCCSVCNHDKDCDLVKKKDPCRQVETSRVLFSERGVAQIGDQVAVVIVGDGVNGVFRGTLVEVDPCFIRVLLTTAVGPIPAGALVTILVEEIAAVARITVAAVV